MTQFTNANHLQEVVTDSKIILGVIRKCPEKTVSPNTG